MSGSKYFVWGSGVWRELDMSSGRVLGWRRRARFVFVRRGRLHVARRRAVLRALQALAAGQPSAAADGPRLSHRSSLVVSAKQQRHALPPAVPAPWEHHHCCAHFNGCINNNKVVNHVAASATPLVAYATCATSATTATEPQKRRETGTQCDHTDAGTSTERAHAITINLTHAVRTKPDSSSGEDFVNTPKRKLAHKPRSNTSEVNSLLGKQKPAETTEPFTLVTREKRAPPSTDDVRSKPSEERRNKARPKSKQRPAVSKDNTDTTSTHEAAPTSITVGNTSRDRRVWDEGDGGDARGAVCKELIISEGDVAVLRGFVARTRASALERFDADDAYKRALFYAINPLVEVERCARLERLLRERHAAALPHFAARLGLTPRSEGVRPSSSSVTSSPSRSQRRRAAARYKERSSSDDTNKENKEAKHTTTNKHRTERNAKLKTAERNATASEPAPRLTRASGTRLGGSERSNKETKLVKKAVEAKGEAKESAAIKDTDDKVVVIKPATKPPVGVHTISKRASAIGAKEYSNLEDHAIVAWVSGGSRASLVNGNRLWRELQEQYHRLTGQSRSWHSLRNRYLRYILPSLGALHLPPADVSRLRAAAATGAIKRKQRQMEGQPSQAAPRARRQSIFKEVPVRSASNRKVPAPQPSPPTDVDTQPTDNDDKGPSSKARRSLRSNAREEDSKKAVPARSPRYSEVTRRFAARHRPSPHTSSTSSPPLLASSSSSSSSPSPSPERVGLRSRRLFNPNCNI